MITALLIYVVLSVIGGLGLYASGVYNDIKNGPDHKFGYNYKSSVTITLCFLVGLPIVNVLFAFFLLWIFVEARRS
jgi:uncharacterized protein HemY